MDGIGERERRIGQGEVTGERRRVPAMLFKLRDFAKPSDVRERNNKSTKTHKTNTKVSRGTRSQTAVRHAHTKKTTSHLLCPAIRMMPFSNTEI